MSKIRISFIKARGFILIIKRVFPFLAEAAPNWRAMLKPWAGVEIFPSKDAAKEKYTLFGKSNLEAMHQDIMKNP